MTEEGTQRGKRPERIGVGPTDGGTNEEVFQSALVANGSGQLLAGNISKVALEEHWL